MRRWKDADPAVKAAIIAGVFTIIAAVTAAVITGTASRPAVKDVPQGTIGTNAPEEQPSADDLVALAIERLAFADGGSQVSDLGCPNGHFFAAPREEIAKNLSVEPEELWTLGRLIPGTLFVAVDTKLSPGDYIRLSAIDVVIESYSPEPLSPPLVMESTTCADEGPYDGEVAFDVILDPKAKRIPLLATRAGVGRTIKQDQPTTLEFGISARAPGWYRINLVITFRHGTTAAAVRLPHSITLFFPSRRDSTWFYYPLGGPIGRLSPQHVSDIEHALNEWGVGFPPPLAGRADRSRLRPTGEDPPF